MFHSVFVPLDRSPLAEQALPLALSIARRDGASLDLVKVHTLYALEEPHCEYLPCYDPVADAEYQKQEQRYLDATGKWLAAMAPVRVTTAVVSGLPADGILRQARDGKADLIVMTSHGRHGVDHFFLGSLAEELIRRAPAPVLIVRPSNLPPSVFPEPVVENVLILLDGSPLAEQVLAPAVELACLLEARCTLFRAVESHSATAEAQAYLQRVVGRMGEERVRVETRVAVAQHAAECILDEGRAHPNQLLALATHGRGGIRRLLLGSVADKIIRGCAAPVLIQPPRQSEGRF